MEGGGLKIKYCGGVTNIGRKICWGYSYMIAAGGPDKRTDNGATEKPRGV